MQTELLDQGSDVQDSDNVNVKVPSKSLSFFHATMNGNGVAMLLNAVSPHFKDDKVVNGAVWVHFLPQNAGTKIGDKNLFNKNKSTHVVMKLNATEVGSLLHVVYGGQNEVGNTDRNGKFWQGLTHKGLNRTSTLFFVKNENGSYKINAIVKEASLNLGLTVFNGGEAVMLSNWLERALAKISPA